MERIFVSPNESRAYYSLILQDKTGTADAKIWELGRGIDIYCEGLVTRVFREISDEYFTRAPQKDEILTRRLRSNDGQRYQRNVCQSSGICE